MAQGFRDGAPDREEMGSRATAARITVAPAAPPSGSCVRPSRVTSAPSAADDGDAPAEPWEGAPLDPKEGPPRFEDLYERWFEDVARWVRALGGPAADRDDLVQDVFLVAYRRLPDFDGRNPAGWLYRIARRRVRDFRRLRWFKFLVQRRGALPEHLEHGAGTPGDTLERKRASALLEQLLDRLNPDQRTAFVLFEIEGYSGREIAELQAVPLNTVWARIHAARKKLARSLEGLDSAGEVRRP